MKFIKPVLPRSPVDSLYALFPEKFGLGSDAVRGALVDVAPWHTAFGVMHNMLRREVYWYGREL